MRILSVWINHGIELGQLAPDNLHQWLMFHWTMIVSVEANEIRVFAWMCPRGLYRKCREIKLLAPTPTQVADLWRLSALVIAFSLLQIPGYPHFDWLGKQCPKNTQEWLHGQGWFTIILPPTKKRVVTCLFYNRFRHKFCRRWGVVPKLGCPRDWHVVASAWAFGMLSSLSMGSIRKKCRENWDAKAIWQKTIPEHPWKKHIVGTSDVSCIQS